MPVPSVIFSLLCRHCYPLLSICDAAVAVAVVEQLNAVVCFCVVVCRFDFVCSSFIYHRL